MIFSLRRPFKSYFFFWAMIVQITLVFCGGCSHHLFYDDCSNRVFVWRLSSTLLQFFAMIVHKFFLRSLSRSHFLAILVHFLFFAKNVPNPVFAHYFWQSSATSISQRISASRNLHFPTSVFNCAIAKKKAIYFSLIFFLRFFFP